ncbi:MAG: ABC transporter permease [Acidobacteria bacterium]|nr:MAG: ABC transporter permease [Acidobacteriota bacterium]
MHELRYAVRILVRNPGFTTIAALALAVGIGANTAIFSIVNVALMRPLPYRNAEHLIMIWDRLSRLGIERFPASFANYLDYQKANRVFDDVAAFSSVDFNLTAAEQAERVPGARVSTNFFPLLGAATVLGRTFVPQDAEPGHDNIVLLSDALWRRRFGTDPNVVGSRITLDGGSFTVIGVMSGRFEFSAGNASPAEIWAPLVSRADPARTAGALHLIARLKPGMTLDQAQTDMASVAQHIDQTYRPYRGPHGEYTGYGVTVVFLRDELYGTVRRGLLVLLGAVGLVLLIACANVANLLLARAAERRKEIAIRKALGAGSVRLARQLLTESLVLALLGGSLGLVLAFWGAAALPALMPAGLPHFEQVPIDARVLVFTLLLSLGTGLIFGLAPALIGSRLNLSESLKETARGVSGGADAGRLRHVLMVSEVALSLLLMVGAGLMIRSFERLVTVNPGFQADRLITARISLNQNQYRENYRVWSFYLDMIERIRSLPGVQSASAVSILPLADSERDPFSIEGRSYDFHGKTPQVASQEVIASDYFRTMQIPLLSGRLFQEREAEPVVIINQTMARGFWPGIDPIGRRIVLGAPRPGVQWLTIAGVVADIHNSRLDSTPLPQMYVPLAQAPVHSMALVIRTTADPAGVIPTVRAQLFALDPNQPLYDVRTMQERVNAAVSQPRFQSLLLAIFAGLALLLALIGTYGVVSRSVTQRTHEIGIRMSLGAEPTRVLTLVLREGVLLAGIGTVLGLAGAWAVRQVLSGLLYGVLPSDPVTYIGASILVFGSTVAACYFPALRAARVDPMTALRCE